MRASFVRSMRARNCIRHPPQLVAQLHRLQHLHLALETQQPAEERLDLVHLERAHDAAIGAARLERAGWPESHRLMAERCAKGVTGWTRPPMWHMFRHMPGGDDGHGT